MYCVLRQQVQPLACRRGSARLALGRSLPAGSRNVKNTSAGCRRGIVTQISSTTSLLRSDETDSEVFLVGTAHVSDESAKEISELIGVVKPKTVFIELDPVRAAQLYNSNQDNFEQDMERSFASFTQNLPMKIPGLEEEEMRRIFRSFYKVLKQCGMVPGIDMIAAMKAGKSHDAKLFYGDQDAGETLRKLRGAFSPSLLMSMMRVPLPPELKETLDLFRSGRSDEMATHVEKFKSREQGKILVDYMDEATPDVTEVLIHERNRIMVERIRQIGRTEGGSMVAVVGMAHLDGMEQEWLDQSSSRLSSSSSSSSSPVPLK